MSKPDDYYDRQDALNNIKKSEVRFRLKAEDGRTATFPFSNVREALDIGFTPVTDEVKVVSSDGRTGKIPSSSLKPALEAGFMLEGPNYKDYGQSFVQGAAAKLGKVSDILVAEGSKSLSNSSLYKGFKSGVDALGLGGNYPTSEQLQTQSSDYWQNPKIEKTLSDPLETGYDSTGIRVSRSAGDFVGDIPILKGVSTGFKGFTAGYKSIKALNRGGTVIETPWLDRINKFLDVPINTRTVAGFAGAGAGSELAKSDDASWGENVLRSLLGGLVGGLTVEHYALPILKSIVTLPKKIKDLPSLKELPDSVKAYIISKFGKEVDLNGYNAFKEAGIDPTPEMIVENNKLVSILGKQKSVLADKVITNANDKSLAAIEEVLDKNLGEYIGRNESDIKSAGELASDRFRTQVLEQKDKLDALQAQKYEDANSVLKPDQFPTANETIKAINEQLKFVDAPSTSYTTESGQGLVATVLKGIKKAWSKDGNAISVNPLQMIAQENALSELKRKLSSKHAKRFQFIRDAIDKDLESAGNEIFVQKYREAKAFQAQEVAPYVKTDMARAILEGSPPKLAYSFTGNAKGIRELKEMVVKHPKGEELVNILLRTKAQERIIEGFTKREMFNSNKFLETFNKSENDEYLKALLGNETFIQIKNKGEVLAKALDRTAKAMQNPSGTTGTLISSLGIYKTAKGALTGNFGAFVEGLGINLLPKMFANALLTPSVAKKLVEYAVKQNDKAFLNALIKNNKSWLERYLNKIDSTGGRGAAISVGAQALTDMEDQSQ